MNNKIRLILDKDVIYYIIMHYLFAETGLAILSGLCPGYLILKEVDLIQVFVTWGILLLPIAIFKLICMVIYYKNDYKRVTNPLIIKLFETLKQNTNHSRLIFLLIVTLPYNVNTLYNMYMEYDWLFHFFEYTTFMYILTSLIPYKVLFYYWDTVSYIENSQPTKKQVIKFVFQKTALFILISISIFVIFEVLSSQRPGC